MGCYFFRVSFIVRASVYGSAMGFCEIVGLFVVLYYLFYTIFPWFLDSDVELAFYEKWGRPIGSEDKPEAHYFHIVFPSIILIFSQDTIILYTYPRPPCLVLYFLLFVILNFRTNVCDFFFFVFMLIESKFCCNSIRESTRKSRLDNGGVQRHWRALGLHAGEGRMQIGVISTQEGFVG